MRDEERTSGAGEDLSARLTKIGKGGLLAGLVVAGAAFNTANNLLYLFLVLLIALYPLSWYLARRAVARVEAELLLPRTVRAGREAEMAVRLRCGPGWGGAPALAVLVAEGGLSARAHWAWIPPGGESSRRFPIRPRRRGPLEIQALLVCPFPFGMIEARRTLPAAETLVLPAPLGPVPDPEGAAGRRGEELVLRKGRGAELLNVREYVPGEDARYLHWKATARLDRPMIREHAREGERRVSVVLDPALPPACPREDGETAVERAISRAAAAIEGLARAGWNVRLLTPAAEAPAGVQGQLEFLARLEIRESPAPSGFWRGSVERSEAVVVLSGERERRRRPAA